MYSRKSIMSEFFTLVSPDIRRFVKVFGKIVRPQHTAFQTIIGYVYNHQVLDYAVYHRPFKLHTGALTSGRGAKCEYDHETTQSHTTDQPKGP